MTNKFNMDVSKENSPNFFAYTGEGGSRTVEVTLYNQNSLFELDGYIATVYTEKPDGTVSYISGTIDENTITFTLTTQMCAVLGKCKTWITLYSATEESTLTVGYIFYEVLLGYDENSIESQDEFSALTDALSDVSSLTTSIQQCQEDIEECQTDITQCQTELDNMNVLLWQGLAGKDDTITVPNILEYRLIMLETPDLNCDIPSFRNKSNNNYYGTTGVNTSTGGAEVFYARLEITEEGVYICDMSTTKGGNTIAFSPSISKIWGVI